MRVKAKTLPQNGWEKVKTFSLLHTNSWTVLLAVLMVYWFVKNIIFHAADQWNDPFLVFFSASLFFTTPPFFPGKLAIASGLGFLLLLPFQLCLSFSRRGKLICWLHSAFSKVFYFGSKKVLITNFPSLEKKNKSFSRFPPPPQAAQPYIFKSSFHLLLCLVGGWLGCPSFFSSLAPFCCLQFYLFVTPI